MTAVTASQIDVLAPLATPLPDAPGEQFFSDDQWTTLMAIMDTIIPSIQVEAATGIKPSQLIVSHDEYKKAVDNLQKNVKDAPQGEALRKYLEEKPSDNPQFQELLRRSLIHFSREDARKGLAFILSALK